MQNSYDLNTTTNRHIENEMSADRETSQTLMEFIPISSHIIELREFAAGSCNFVKEFVRIVGVKE
jgi:hypothetical protein